MSGQLPCRTLFHQDLRPDSYLLPWLAEMGCPSSFSAGGVALLCRNEFQKCSYANMLPVFTIFTKPQRKHLPVFSIVFLKDQAKQKHPTGYIWPLVYPSSKSLTLPQPHKQFCFPAVIHQWCCSVEVSPFPSRGHYVSAVAFCRLLQVASASLMYQYAPATSINQRAQQLLRETPRITSHPIFTTRSVVKQLTFVVTNQFPNS